jgi:holin-like protein
VGKMSAPRKLAMILHRSLPLQIALLFALWWTGNQLAGVFHLPVSGAVVGLGLLLALLATRQLSARSLRRGAGWLIGEMLLFFVPVALAVLGHRELLGLAGLKILVVILVSTAAVMGATAFVVDLSRHMKLGDAHTPVPTR